MLSLTVSLTEGATGLTNLDARWYNPYSQRFVQPDYWSFQNTGLPLEVQHELLRFSRLDTQQLLADPSQQLAYGYVAGNALAWSDQMGLGLFSWAKEKASSAGRKIKERSSKISKKLSSIKESSKSYWVNKGSKYVNDNSSSGKLKYGLAGAAYVLADSFPGSTTDAALYTAGGVASKALSPLASQTSKWWKNAKIFFGETKIANPIPKNFARVVPNNINPKTLGNTNDVFVTDVKSLDGLDAAKIAERLTIPKSSTGFKVIEFSSDQASGIASPVLRTNPGFIGGGQTAGGAPEFVIQNSPIPVNAIIKEIQ